MERPVKLLDLFCGAGGATKGYQRAGFYVVGVDIRPQPNYCGNEFVQMDALEYAQMQFVQGGRAYWKDFDAIHASPPCQSYSKTRAILRGKGLTPRYEPLIEETRALLRWAGVPWVMENVPGAPLLNPLTLSGQHFGLRVIRRRLFESSVLLLAPDVPVPIGGTNSHRGYSRGGAYVTVGGHNYNVAEGKQAMGINWMTRDELNEAIPPAYTEYLGRQLRTYLESAA
jgi:DNA (cytosine-5)-methyltransferase 1